MTTAAPNRGRRITIAVLLGIVAAFVLGAMTVGFMRAGSPWIAWHGLREMGGSRFEMTAAAPDSGVQPGDVLALSDLSLAQRLAFRFVAADAGFPCPVQRDGQRVMVHCPFGPSPPLPAIGATVDIGFRLLLLCSGLLVIVRGRDQPSLTAGLYLGSQAMADTLVVTFAGLPVAIQVAGIMAARLARLLSYIALCDFGLRLLGELSAKWRRTLWSIFGLLFTAVAVVQMNAPTDLLFGKATLTLPVVAGYLPHVMIQIYALGLIAVAASRARGASALTLRVIFWSVLVVVTAFTVPAAYLAFRQLPPVWMFWFFNLALAGVAVGFPWAILRRKLVAVDFFLNRAAVSLIAAGIVVFLINLLETAAENNITDFENSTLLQYAVPLAVGLSFNAIQNLVSRSLERTLYRDRQRAAAALRSMIARMPESGDMVTVSNLAVDTISRVMRSRTVTLFVCETEAASYHPVATTAVAPTAAVPPDDPACAELRQTRAPVLLDGLGSTLGGGLLLPLAVFGWLVGALHCDRRSDETYDPVERALLMEVAHELAIALVCLDAATTSPRFAGSARHHG
jgi:hypothetical protein